MKFTKISNSQIFYEKLVNIEHKRSNTYGNFNPQVNRL